MSLEHYKDGAEFWFHVYESGYVNSDDSVDVFVQAMPVIKHTAKGVWLDNYGVKRFVLKGQGKFAAPTIEEAVKMFIRRKELHLRFLAARHDRIARVVRDSKDERFQPKNLERVLEIVNNPNAFRIGML